MQNGSALHILKMDILNIELVKLGKKMAQFALFCGANDVGGTLMNEGISKFAERNPVQSVIKY